MIKKSIRVAIFGVAGIALLFAACKKNEGDSTAPLNFKKGQASVTCLDSTKNFLGNIRSASTFGNYSGWGTVNWTIPLGSNPQLQFEGELNAAVRPISNNWFIGVVDTAYVCSGWTTISTNLQVKNFSAATIGTAPGSPYIPQNVVGAIGTVTPPGSNFGTVGWYNYSTPNATPAYAIVVWHVDPSSGTWPTANTQPDLTDADEAYILWSPTITASPLGMGNYQGSIPFKWDRVL